MTKRSLFTRTSWFLLSGFFATIALIMYVWWPLVEQYVATADPRYPIWMQLDLLLVGIFLAMTLLIMIRADLRRDWLIVFVGLCGGLVIESWGTQTHLWNYFTLERPPLWIIPAWPIASLSIDRLERFLAWGLPKGGPKIWKGLYWAIFVAFYALMLWFVWPTLDKSLTWAALITCALLILTPTDHRTAVLTFLAGSGLGYFLERWGTTRQCWSYYTFQTPPLFAVLAHGLAAVAFWRAGIYVKMALDWIARRGAAEPGEQPLQTGK